MASNAEKNSVVSYLHWVIGLVIMFLGYVLPASEPLTPMGVKVLTIFAGMIYLWCTTNPIGGSLLALFVISITGYAPFNVIIADAISESSWLVVFFGCVLFMSSIESGMPNYVSHGIFKATKSFTNGRPMILVFVIMCTAFVLAALTDVIPTILMFWAISYAIIDDLKLNKTDRYSMFLVMSSFMGAMLGNALFPFKGATIIIISAFQKASGIPIPYGSYIVINLVCCLIIMAAYVLLAKYVLRIDLSKVKNIDSSVLASNTLPPMSVSVKAHMLAILGFIAMVLANSFLPKESSVGVFLAALGTEGIAIIMIILLFIVQDQGKPCLKIGKTMASMPWGAVFMVMAAVYMAGVLKNGEVTGIIPWLKSILNPILGGHGEFVFAALLVILAMILTCLFHNGALGNMMMPVLFAVSSANGYHSVAIASIMTMAINVAFLAPSASNWAPLLHANKEYITMKDIWTYGLLFEILTFVVFFFLGFPMAKIMM